MLIVHTYTYIWQKRYYSLVRWNILRSTLFKEANGIIKLKTVGLKIHTVNFTILTCKLEPNGDGVHQITR